MKKFLLTLAAAAVMLPLAAAEYCNIYNVKVILPESPSNFQKEAAAELKNHLSKILSKPLKLNGTVPAAINMYIGYSEDARKAGFVHLPAAENLPGKFGVYRNGSDFLFYGWDFAEKDPSLYNGRAHCGSFFAVSYFLQKYMQVKCIMPGEKYVFYQPDVELNFPDKADLYLPSFKVRYFSYNGKGANWRESTLWYRRNLGYLPEKSRAQYAYFFVNVWNKRFADRKEFWGLYNNRRFNGKYPYHFPCTSNPEVVQQIIDDIDAHLKKHPEVRGIRFFCDAPVKSCECENCRTSPAGKYVTEEDHSETVYALLSHVGHRLNQLHKGLIFHVQTKGASYHQPPRSIKLPENVTITILTGQFHRPDYEQIRQKCAQWRAAGAWVIAKSYPRSPEMKDYPIMNPHRIAEYYRELAGHIEGSMSAEGRGTVNWSFSALNNYVHCKVMSDSTIDVDKVIAEFCALAAPGASAELKAFYDCMEQLLSTANFRDDPLMNCYISFRLKEPRKLLDAALKKAPDAPFLIQLNKDFAELEQKSAVCSGKIKNQAELDELFRGFSARQEPLTLSEKANWIPFRAFAFYRDYQPGKYMIRRDSDKLVIAAECSENMIKDLVTDCKINFQGQIWNDDVIEVFFGAPGKAEPYLHLAVNARGVYRVTLGDSKNLLELTKFPLAVKYDVRKDSWGVEMSFPISALKDFISNNQTDIAIYRHRPSRGSDKNQVSGAQSANGGIFRDPSGRFRILNLQ